MRFGGGSSWDPQLAVPSPAACGACAARGPAATSASGGCPHGRRSTCDGICSRILAPLTRRLLLAEPPTGAACARAVLAWSRHPNLWLRRTSVVAFVTLARRPDEQVRGAWRQCTACSAAGAPALNSKPGGTAHPAPMPPCLPRLPQVFPGFRAALLEALAALVQGHERFAQTGAGWVLRELGKGDSQALLQASCRAGCSGVQGPCTGERACMHAPPAAALLHPDAPEPHRTPAADNALPACPAGWARLAQFVEAHLPHFSAEGLRYALEQQQPEVRQRLMAAHKAAVAAARSAAQAVPAAPPPAPKRRRGR